MEGRLQPASLHPPARGRAAVALALSACFFTRLLAGSILVTRGSFLQHDGQDYFELAQNLASFKGYLIGCSRWFEPPRKGLREDFSRPPLLPFALASWLVFLPDSIWVAVVFQALVGTLFCIVCAALAKNLWGDRAYWTALALCGAFPNSIYYSAHLSTEAMMSLLVALSIAAMWSLEADSYPMHRAALCGATLGISALCRPTALLTIPLAAVWAALSLKLPRARRTAACALLILSAGLAIAPWTVRNLVSGGGLIPVTNLGGYVFWLGNNEEAFRAYASWSYSEFLEHQAQAFGPEGSRLVEEMVEQGISGPQAEERFWFGKGFDFVRKNPGKYLFLCWMRLGHFFRPWPNPAAYGWAASLLSALMWCTLYAAAVIGLARLWKHRPAAAAAIIVVVVSGAIAHALTHVMLRHRAPFVDTAALILASPVLNEWVSRLLKRT